MKRSQASSPQPESSSHPYKKLKISPPGNQGIVQDGVVSDSGEWTKVENRKAKKIKKAQANFDKNPPRFMYVNSDIVKRKEAIRIDDIRELVLHLIGDAPPVGWLKVENSRSIQKVVTLLIPGLIPSLLALPPLPTSATINPNIPLAIPLPDTSSSDISYIASTFSHACPTRAPGEPTRMHSVLSAFFHGPVSGEEKKKRMQQRLISERTLEKDPARYVISLEQMVENDYPIPSYMADIFQKPPGWVETPEALKASLLSSSPAKKAKIYAIDCEMCLTEDGKELTRVCMVDYTSGIVIYDKLVKPPKPIKDYLTRWSGITAEALAPITTSLSEVQDHLLKLLSPPASSTPILLGHSLESDLKALKLCHPRCIDTALVYHHPRGRPLKPGLAWLTKKWCGRMIQTRGEGGHDPEEDARACLDLMKMKVENGPGFGEFKTDHESIFERMSRAVGRGGPGSIRSAVVDHGNPAVMHGAKANTSVSCTSDAEVLDGLVQVIPGHDFSFGRFTALADGLGWLTPKVGGGSASMPEEPHPPHSPVILKHILQNLNTQLTTLHAALPPRTSLIIFTGHSDPRRMTALNVRKSAFEDAIKSGKTAEDIDKDMWWTSSDARELEEEVEIAKRGLLFLSIK